MRSSYSPSLPLPPPGRSASAWFLVGSVRWDRCDMDMTGAGHDVEQVFGMRQTPLTLRDHCDLCEQCGTWKLGKLISIVCKLTKHFLRHNEGISSYNGAINCFDSTASFKSVVRCRDCTATNKKKTVLRCNDVLQNYCNYFTFSTPSPFI